MPHVTTRLSLCLVLACGLAAAAHADDKDAEQRFLSDKQLKQNIINTAAKSTVMLRHACSTATYAAQDPIELKPMTFDQYGSPTTGELKIPVKEDGCGASHLLNVYLWVQREASIAITPMLPGTSRAEDVLQKQAYAYALQAAGGPEPNCPTGYVDDTQFVGEQGKPEKGAKAAPWKEVWTLQSCGWKAEVPLLFTPNASGIKVTPGAKKDVKKEATEQSKL
jgi:hypothetical protein